MQVLSEVTIAIQEIGRKVTTDRPFSVCRFIPGFWKQANRVELASALGAAFVNKFEEGCKATGR